MGLTGDPFNPTISMMSCCCFSICSCYYHRCHPPEQQSSPLAAAGSPPAFFTTTTTTNHPPLLLVQVDVATGRAPLYLGGKDTPLTELVFPPGSHDLSSLKEYLIKRDLGECIVECSYSSSQGGWKLKGIRGDKAVPNSLGQ